MKKGIIHRTIFTVLLITTFIWGLGYLILKAFEIAKPATVSVETTENKGIKIIQPATKNFDSKLPYNDDSSNKLIIMIAGDMMFDRNIRALGMKNGYESLFDDSVISLFRQADIAVANLEGPITSNPSKNLIDGKPREVLIFTFSREVRGAIKNAGIDIVSLANNHTDNFGFLGFLETQDWLQNVGISWFGNPWNSTSTKMNREQISGNSPITTIVHKNGFDVAFIGYHAFQKGLDGVISEIKRVSGPDVFTIVMPHWGEEYIATSSSGMKSLARTFITAGADAVIGAHPHVIMNNEWVGPVPIYYSVGNLLFDQYFSSEVMKGLVVEMHLSKNASGIYLDNLKTHNTLLKKGKGVILAD